MTDKELKEEFKEIKFLIFCGWTSLAFMLILLLLLLKGGI